MEVEMKNLLFCSAIFIVLASGRVQAQNSFYLKVDDIHGEATDHMYKDWIVCVAIGNGVSNTAASAENYPPLGRPKFQDFTVTKYVDKASPNLNIACAKGTHLKEVELVCVRIAAANPGYVAYRFTLNDAMVKSIQVKGEMPALIEDIAFSFKKIKWEYTPLLPNGTPGGKISAEWDVQMNKGN
jgi:type VI secretion system secreted protein Hcp